MEIWQIVVIVVCCILVGSVLLESIICLCRKFRHRIKHDVENQAQHYVEPTALDNHTYQSIHANYNDVCVAAVYVQEQAATTQQGLKPLLQNTYNDDIYLRQNELQQRFQQQCLEEQRLEKQRLEQKLENQRLQKQRLEQERLEKRRLEEQRLEKQRLEQILENHRLQKQRLEQERLEKRRLEEQRLEKQRLEKQRLEKRKLEEQRLEEKKIEQVRIQQQQQRSEQEKLEKQKIREPIVNHQFWIKQESSGSDENDDDNIYIHTRRGRSKENKYTIEQESTEDECEDYDDVGNRRGRSRERKVHTTKRGSEDRYHSRKREFIHPDKLLDLHYLLLDEAMNTFILFLRTKENEYHNSNYRRVDRFIQVITGRGIHSTNRIPKIKPRVHNYLEKNNYAHEWKNNGGMVTIDLLSKRTDYLD